MASLPSLFFLGHQNLFKTGTLRELKVWFIG
uniref:Uncharacterized protein n=1 Tax=Tetranychus urticae TaxID=32264 RepID=T1JUQ8_TETUR